MTIQIPNFVENSTVGVAVIETTGALDKKLVLVCQYSGSCTFNHAMTSKQARQMAMALLTMADAAEVADEPISTLD
jgi:hypothetical protein